MQIVRQALRYFADHFRDGIAITEMATDLQISEANLNTSFDQIRGMTVTEALQDYRLNQLFASLTDKPRQGLTHAIRRCGLGQTAGVLPLFEETFGIPMPLFLLTCRRAAEDREFRRHHPGPQALVLPPP